MRNSFKLALVLVSLLSVMSCETKESESCSQMSITSLTLNVPVNESIPSFGTKYYSFEITTAGDYTIALTLPSSDCSWDVYNYISDCLNDYIEEDPAPLANSSGTLSVNLQPGTYLLVVDEWDGAGTATYTLEVQD